MKNGKKYNFPYMRECCNGSQAALRTQCPCGHVGPSPTLRTISDIINKIKNKISVRSYRALDSQVLYPVTPLRRGVKPSALYAEMAKQADAPASKAGVERRVGPSPTFGTSAILHPRIRRIDRPSFYLLPTSTLPEDNKHKQRSFT